MNKKTPGRNDPCPCGSGKKYKNCCLNQDRARRIRQSAWRSDEQDTLNKLLAFAQRPALNPQYPVAFNLFWNGTYGVEGLHALDRDEVGRFLDWYVYDYRLEGSAERLIDVFVNQMGAQLLADERERVRAWQNSHLSLYRIVGLAEDGSLPVVDVFQGQQAVVFDSGLGRLGLQGDLIVGRVLRSSVVRHFSWAAILLPADQEAGLASFVTLGYRRHREVRTAASWPEFLSESGYLINHHLLKAAAEAGKPRNSGRVYYDAFRTVEKLRDAETRLREVAAKRAAELRKTEQPATEEKVDALRQTKGGILLPDHVHYKGSKEVEL